jgi:hypothetical protein
MPVQLMHKAAGGVATFADFDLQKKMFKFEMMMYQQKREGTDCDAMSYKGRKIGVVIEKTREVTT